MAYRCVYCNTTITHTSFQAKKKHINGRKHHERVAEYWLRVGKRKGLFGPTATIENVAQMRSAGLDQTSELDVFRVPGLDPRAEEYVGTGSLPAPANIPTAKFPKTTIT